MKTLLTAHGVYSIATGDRTKLTMGEEAMDKWEKDNARAMCLISSAMTYDQLEPLTNCSMAKDMWSLLATVHEQKRETNKLIMMQKFYEYKMQPNDSVMQHIAKVQSLANALKDLKENISDISIMDRCLQNLMPSSWHGTALKPASRQLRTYKNAS
ncbi:uncharacterized protein LOC106645307 [Copidosoma floridanum]|uniref:uncharacterized protein LOC106645307 n=1 Tax=Copidosoma floridanum TaxID=29053 RepID=UPI0006C99CC5|nr:uncharacterized protein LOC106645307 [Copidosoma floridanum]